MRKNGKSSKNTKIGKTSAFWKKINKKCKKNKKNLHNSKLFTTFARYFWKIMPKLGCSSCVYSAFWRCNVLRISSLWIC